MNKVKQEAERLIERFKDHAKFDWGNHTGYEVKNWSAKQCALICVDEMEKKIYKVYDSEKLTKSTYSLLSTLLRENDELKTEIQKL